MIQLPSRSTSREVQNNPVVAHVNQIHEVAAHLLDVGLVHQRSIDQPDHGNPAPVGDIEPRPLRGRPARGGVTRPAHGHAPARGQIRDQLIPVIRPATGRTRRRDCWRSSPRSGDRRPAVLDTRNCSPAPSIWPTKGISDSSFAMETNSLVFRENTFGWNSGCLSAHTERDAIAPCRWTDSPGARTHSGRGVLVEARGVRERSERLVKPLPKCSGLFVECRRHSSQIWPVFFKCRRSLFPILILLDQVPYCFMFSKGV